MRSREAFTLIELLVVVAIIAILAAILFPVFSRAREKALATSCISNVKQLAMSTLTYMQDYDERFPVWSAPGVPGNWELYAQWYYKIYPYLKNAKVYECPSTKVARDWWLTQDNWQPQGSFLSYGFNEALLHQGHQGQMDFSKMSTIERPAQLVMLGDCMTPWLPHWGTMRAALPDYPGGELGWDDQYDPNDPRVQAAVRNIGLYTRHNLGSNLAFCDGHAKWFRWDAIWKSHPELDRKEPWINPWIASSGS